MYVFVTEFVSTVLVASVAWIILVIKNCKIFVDAVE